MINEYVIKLIENLPDDIKNIKEPLRMDVVLVEQLNYHLEIYQ